MADMLKFYKGLVASLPETGANGAIYITTDEGGIYLGTGTGIKRLGDFVQVADVKSLPAKAHETGASTKVNSAFIRCNINRAISTSFWKTCN